VDRTARKSDRSVVVTVSIRIDDQLSHGHRSF